MSGETTATTEPKAGKTEPKAGEANPEPAHGKRKKRGLLLGGGAAAIVALGWALALVAVPKPAAEAAHEPEPQTQMLDVTPSNGFQVNLSGMGGKHYLAMNITLEVDAAADAHVAERAAEPLIRARLSDTVLRVASRKTKADLADAAGKELFREELRVALEQVLFPIHVGNVDTPARHAESGLRPGASNDLATLRGPFHQHALELDAAKRTIRLDEGPSASFEGDETDLELRDELGRSLFVDVSDVEPGFRGEVHAGVQGSVRAVYFTAFLVQ